MIVRWSSVFALGALIAAARGVAGDSAALAVTAHTSQQTTPRPQAGVMAAHPAKHKKPAKRKKAQPSPAPPTP